MRSPLLHPSSLSPSEFEAYINIINLLELEKDDNLHIGTDFARASRIYDWIKGFLINSSERSTELLFLSFFKSSNNTATTSNSPSSWILIGILRLISHSIHSKILTRDHLFIQTYPIELLSTSTSTTNNNNKVTSTSWTNPFYSSPKIESLSLAESQKSHFTNPPLPLKLRSVSSPHHSSTSSSSSSFHSLNKSTNGIGNNNPFKNKMSLPDLNHSSSNNNSSSIPSSTSYYSPTTTIPNYSNPNSPNLHSNSSSSSSSKPPLPPRKPSISANYSKPLPPRTKSIESNLLPTTQTNMISSKKSMSIIGSKESEIEILEPSRTRIKLSVESNHIGLDSTKLRQDPNCNNNLSPNLNQEEEDWTESRIKMGRSDSLNSNSSLNLLGVAYAATLAGGEGNISPIIPQRGNSISFEGSKSFVGLGGEPESPGSFLVSAPTSTKEILSEKNLNSLSKESSSSLNSITVFRSPPPRRLDLPSTTPPLKSSPTFTTTTSNSNFQSSSMIGSSLNRSKTVGSKPSIPPFPMPNSSSTSTTIISSSNPPPPPPPPPKRLRPESSHFPSTSSLINPFLGPISLSSSATFITPPSLNLSSINNLSNGLVNSLGSNSSRKTSLSTSSRSSISSSTTVKTSPILDGLRRSSSVRSAPVTSSTSISNRDGIGLGLTEEYSGSSKKKKEEWILKAKNGLEKVNQTSHSTIIILEKETNKLGKKTRTKSQGSHTKEEKINLVDNDDENENSSSDEDLVEIEGNNYESEEQESIEEHEGFINEHSGGVEQEEEELSLGNVRRDSRRESSGRELGWVGLS